MHSRKTIVDKMISWVGCKEGDPTHKHIIDTYNSHKPLPGGYKMKYTDAWCAATVSAAAIECGYTDIIPVECSCARMIDLYKKMGIWEESDAYVPNPGDVIFYDWQDNGVGDNKDRPDHVGVVEKVDSGQIVVIEGNKNDGVERRTLSVNGKYIRGFGLPAYDKGSAIAKASHELYGLDLSANQIGVDFAKVKQNGIDFVILRSTTRNGLPDTKFTQYYENAKKAGIEVQGVYKYSYAMNPPEAFNEAKGVVELLKGKKLTIWYDMEDSRQSILPKSAIFSIAHGFLDYCQASGYDVGIYCNFNWYKSYIDDALKKQYKFWIARYGKNDGTAKECYKPNVNEMIWQYTSKGSIPGVPGNVDMNILYR